MYQPWMLQRYKISYILRTSLLITNILLYVTNVCMYVVVSCKVDQISTAVTLGLCKCRKFPFYCHLGLTFMYFIAPLCYKIIEYRFKNNQKCLANKLSSRSATPKLLLCNTRFLRKLTLDGDTLQR